MLDIKTNKLSIYLIKDEYSKHEEILKDKNNLSSQEITDIGTFYYGASHSSRPSWLKNFFAPPLSNNEVLFNASSKGILLTSVKVESSERIFAIPFGYGWHLLNPSVYEHRFGLKVALNIVDPDSLRRIDKKRLSSAPKDTSEQLTQMGTVADFGIDIEQDLVTGVTGKSRHEQFGNIIKGKDAFTASVKYDSSNIKDFLVECYEKYKCVDYKKNFDWIDQIMDIKSPKKIKELDNKLIEHIKNSNWKKVWMAVPELIDWFDIKGFTYKEKTENYQEDISIEDFLESLSENKRNNLDLEILKTEKIYCYDANNDLQKYKWSVYNCLYCEVHDDENNKIYLLSNAKWYEIEQDFVGQINNGYKKLRDKGHVISLPDYHHENENDYNNKVAVERDEFCCMDRQNISYGGGHSAIEFCDLFAKDNKLIHVKHYGGSSVLSHLFSQGLVSGELFIMDEGFRKKVNQKLPSSHKIPDPSAKPDASKYHVVYAIICPPSKDVVELPFFSKVSLKNARQTLEAMGYEVVLQKIKR